MSVTLIVNNIPFDYPEQGEQAPWGEAATGWASEVTNVLSTVKGPADILESFFDLANNQTTFANIPGFSFNSSTVRSFEIYGNIYRVYSSGVSELVEEYTLTGLNTGADWVITREGFGEAGVDLEITSSGQVQYKSSNLSGHVSSKIKFRGTAVLK
jgi:hypothetical protein